MVCCWHTSSPSLFSPRSRSPHLPRVFVYHLSTIYLFPPSFNPIRSFLCFLFSFLHNHPHNKMLQPRLSSLLLSLAVMEAGAIQPQAAQPTGALLLNKRQESCPAGYFSCPSTADELLCCANGWVCTADADNDAACCPSG